MDHRRRGSKPVKAPQRMKPSAILAIREPLARFNLETASPGQPAFYFFEVDPAQLRFGLGLSFLFLAALAVLDPHTRFLENGFGKSQFHLRFGDNIPRQLRPEHVHIPLSRRKGPSRNDAHFEPFPGFREIGFREGQFDFQTLSVSVGKS